MSHNILFGTPIWEFNLNSYIDNSSLRQEGLSYRGGNFFDLGSNNISILKTRAFEISNDISKQYNWRNPPIEIYGMQRPLRQNEIDTPHYHSCSKLVGVYYVAAEPNCGDILFYDPRGGTDWLDPNATTETTGKMSRTYHRVTPVSGMLLLFPSYLIHSVEPNLSASMRVSIAIDIYDDINDYNKWMSRISTK